MHILDEIEIRNLPLHGAGACLDLVMVAASVDEADYSEWDLIGLRVGSYDARAKAWTLSDLSKDDALFVAIRRAMLLNKPTMEIVNEAIAEQAHQELGPEPTKEFGEPEWFEHRLSGAHLGLRGF